MAKKHINLFFFVKKTKPRWGGPRGVLSKRPELFWIFFLGTEPFPSIDSSMYMKVCYFSLAALELASLAFVDVVVSDEVFSLEGFEALAEPEVELVGLVSIAAFWGVAEP